MILISQGSSEHSICCAIPRTRRPAPRPWCARAFARELAEGQIQSVDVTSDLAILAVVGDGMAGMPGVAGKVFNALGSAQRQRARHRPGRIGAQYFCRGRRPQATRALRAVHARFYLSPHTLSIGSSARAPSAAMLLDQLASQTRAPGARVQY